MDYIIFLIFLMIIFIIACYLISHLYFKYNKLGQALKNKNKNDREEFINKWGKK